MAETNKRPQNNKKINLSFKCESKIELISRGGIMKYSLAEEGCKSFLHKQIDHDIIPAAMMLVIVENGICMG